MYTAKCTKGIKRFLYVYKNLFIKNVKLIVYNLEPWCIIYLEIENIFNFKHTTGDST